LHHCVALNYSLLSTEALPIICLSVGADALIAINRRSESVNQLTRLTHIISYCIALGGSELPNEL